MTGDDDRGARAELARWFIDHDEVDEAARVLGPGDELVVGASDYLDLAAALGRRGLTATYHARRARVAPAGDLGATARKPPRRTTAASPSRKKKTA
jgi:hypothetical protein